MSRHKGEEVALDADIYIPERASEMNTLRILRDLIKEEVKKATEKLACPRAAGDLKLNTEHRDRAIKAKHIQYGPLNLSDKKYWKDLADHWKTDVSVAKKSKCGNCAAFDISPRMKECMPGDLQDDDGHLGYCWMHDFKCHSARTCRTWAAGGPIKTDKVSASWQEKK